MTLNFDMTTMPTIVFWLLGLLVFGIGSALGYFSMNVEARKRLDAMETKAEIVRADAEKKLADAERKLEEARALGGGVLSDSPTLLQLRREKGAILADLDGQPLAGSLSPDKRKRLLELISYFRPWIEGGQTPAVPPAPEPVSQSLTASTPQPSPAPVPTPVASPAIKPVSLFGGAPKQTDPQTEFKLLSMVQQIDVVLQKRIAGTEIEKLGVHLQDSTQGGLEVHIGSQIFETIDDVPISDVRTAIRAAIAEWETKYVPGV